MSLIEMKEGHVNFYTEMDYFGRIKLEKSLDWTVQDD